MKFQWLEKIEKDNKEKIYKLLIDSINDSAMLGFDSKNKEQISKYIDKLAYKLAEKYSELLIVHNENCNSSVHYIGMTVLSLNNIPTHKHVCEISKTFINKEYRGGEVLSKGFYEILIHCQRIGVEIITFDVRKGTRAEKIWKRLGFQVYGDMKHYSKYQGNYFGGTYFFGEVDKLLRQNTEKPKSYNYEYKDETNSIRSNEIVDGSDSNCELMVLTSSYRFDSPLDAQDKFSGKKHGHVYSRISNPSIDAFEGRAASLEKAKYSTAFASGMAGIDSVISILVKTGDHIVCSGNVFGTTIHLLKQFYSRLGIEVSLVDAKKVDLWEMAIKSNTKVIMFETPTNPTLTLIDIRKVVEKYKRSDLKIIVDNTLATPYATKPLELGADISIHSASKYMDGQGRVSGGLVLTDDAEIQKSLKNVVRSKGNCISPFNAWIILKSLETLGLRIKNHSNNALSVAKFMEGMTIFDKVIYPGLKSHPQYQLAQKQHNDIHGGIITFSIQGGYEEAWAFIENLNLITLSTNIGDTKTLITHPFSTTHGRMSKEDKDRFGIQPNMLRLSIGLENQKDLISDIQLASEMTEKKR